MKDNITVLLTTCDRYNTTFPLCLLSILNQTRKPNRIVIVDDSLNNKFHENDQIKQLLTLAKYKSVVVDYYFGESKGQVFALQKGFEKIKEGWIFKTDDDNILEPNVLEIFEKNISDEIGAMSGVIVMDKDAFYRKETDVIFSSKIEDIYSHFNTQMIFHQSNEPKEAEHLYSNYFFKKEYLSSYPLELQPSSYREDTIVTYTIYNKNYKLYIYPEVKIYHFGTNNGNKKWGIKQNLKNERIFLQKLKEWGVVPNKFKIIEDKTRICALKDGISYLVFDKKYE